MVPGDLVIIALRRIYSFEFIQNVRCLLEVAYFRPPFVTARKPKGNEKALENSSCEKFRTAELI